MHLAKGLRDQGSIFEAVQRRIVIASFVSPLQLMHWMLAKSLRNQAMHALESMHDLLD